MSAELDSDFCPYQGLEPYTEENRDYFVGRERDKKVVVSNLFGVPLTILYGVSGVGKTSVLLAGVAPEIRKTPGVAVAVFRDWQDDGFALALKKVLLEAVSKSTGREIKLDLTDPFDQFLLKCNLELDGPILVILDQFEEYLLYHPYSKGEEEFDAQFARAINRKDTDANFLVAIREEELSNLDRFRGRVPNYLGNTLRLKQLDRAAAIQAVRKPLIVYNRRVPKDRRMGIEKALVDKLVESAQQLPRGNGAREQTSNSAPEEPAVETPVLQLLLKRLWKEEKKDGSHRLRLSTLEEKLKGAEQVIRTYLDESLAGLEEVERDTLAKTSLFLVTRSGAKIAHEPSTLADWAGLKEDQVKSVFDKLSLQPNIRILRKVAVAGKGDRYEIFHDVLGKPLLSWSSDHVHEHEKAKAAKRAAIEAAEHAKEEARQRELEQAKALAAERQQRLEDKDRANKRLKWMVGCLVVMIVFVIAMSILAVRNSSRADRSASLAKKGQQDAEKAHGLALVANDTLTTLLIKNQDFQGNLDRFEEALQFYRESGNPFGEGVTLAAIGQLYYVVGEYRIAEETYKEALGILEKALSPENQYVASILGKLALVYSEQGKYSEAEQLFRQAQTILEKTLGPENIAVATNLDSLGELYQRQGNYQEAEPLFRRALDIDEKVRGPDHQQVAIDLSYLASLYLEQGRFNEAEPLYERARMILEKAVEPDHPTLASLFANMASLYSQQGKYGRAEPLFKRAMNIHEKVWGSNHPQVALDLNNLASLYNEEGFLYNEQSRYAKAEPLFNRALAIFEKAFGPDHRNVASVLDGLGFTHCKQRKYAQAEPLLRRALAIQETALGKDHPDVAGSLNNLAECYRDQAKFAEAEPLFKRALAIREAALGRESPYVAYTLNELALLYFEQGNYVDAEALFKEALVIREKLLGSDHPYVANTLEDYAALLRKTSRETEAAEMEARAKRILAKRE
ncbi:MAG TPA: tetratricopeptide repeat protein [Blastocatellia bacterium]|nr:tetratricopeptide repeat protein [Blastocatellia bacterium]